MSGSRPNPAQRRVADQHLGDRLSALVDGELGHESRERVLAHLATCAKCKAEAAAQRRLKNVFAEMAPPPPSESFLARLQGLPGGGDSDAGMGSPLGGGAFGGRIPGGSAGTGVFGVRGEPFGYVPAEPHADVLPPSSGRGFRIHDVSRHEAERSASRGLRFAFAAAGAVSLAAVALGGVSTGTTGDTTAARGESGTGSNVTPTRPPGAGASTAPESQRRRSVGPLLAQGERTLGQSAVAPTEVSAPLLPGVPAPPDRAQEVMHTLTAPMVAGAAVMSPLIRPFTEVEPIALTSWSTAPDVTTPGLLAAPAPLSSPSSSPSPTSPSSGTLR
ncbi:zf-HC2 domain-containing protein [Streptomyces sp. NBC_00554]|uniref:zf-HC2 domain-containing protein n=1 Tax=unclassified Streptomyces TaxID=2593676 RepID=UPI00352C0201|nr:zf-HC2 domain-containing protein [Streptomyces sp. NBC_00564]WUC49633.1 zf-HC2 domain-containing protein [Streptomyces sp. NBC_00554]